MSLAPDPEDWLTNKCPDCGHEWASFVAGTCPLGHLHEEAKRTIPHPVKSSGDCMPIISDGYRSCPHGNTFYCVDCGNIREEYNTPTRVAQRTRSLAGHLNQAVAEARTLGNEVTLSLRRDYEGNHLVDIAVVAGDGMRRFHDGVGHPS